MTIFLAVDTETTGLDWFDEARPFIATVSDEHQDEGYVLSPWGADDEAFKARIESATDLIFHNAPFDIHQLVAAGFYTIDEMYERWRIHDTMIIARVLFSSWELGNNFGLKPLADQFLNDNSSHEQSRVLEIAKSLGLVGKTAKTLKSAPADAYLTIWEHHPDIMMDYALKDTRLTWDLHQYFQQVIDNAPQFPTPDGGKAQHDYRKTIDFERQVQEVTTRMEHTGITINPSTVKQLFDNYQDTSFNAEADFKSMVDVGEDFNMSSKSDIADALVASGVPLAYKTPKTGKFSVSDKVLQYHQSYPQVQAYQEWMRADKFLSTFISPMVGREVIHPNFNSIGADTHRMSCYSPNLQNIPVRSGAQVREAFVPREGKALVVCDYSAIEPRTLAYFMDDQEFWDAIINGDPYIWLGTRMFGKDQGKWLVSRSSLKTMFLAHIYGSGGAGMAAKLFELRAKDGNPMASFPTVEDGQKFNRMIRKGIGPKYFDLRNRLEAACKRYGAIRNIDRRLIKMEPGYEYKALNYMMQSSAAVILKEGLLAAQDAINPFGGVLLLPVHDEIAAEVDKAVAQEAGEVMRAAMLTAVARIFARYGPNDPKVDPDSFPLDASLAVCYNSYAEAK